MNLKNALMGMGLVAAVSGSSLSAQEFRGFDAGLNLTYATGALKDQFTKRNLGFIVEGGYTGRLAATDVPFRTGLAINYFPGSDEGGVKASLMGYQLSGDIFINSGYENLRLVTGISVNKWQTKVEAAGLSTSETVKGVKLGGRMGLDYAINNHLSASVMLQVVEYGTDALQTKSLNPCWLQFGAHYRF